MGGEDTVDTQETPRRPWLAALRIFGLVLAFYSLSQDVENLVANANALPGQGQLAIKTSRSLATPDGFRRVAAIDADAAIAQAGLAPGDLIHFDHTFDYLRRLRAGEPVGLTVNHNGQLRHISVTAAPVKPLPVWSAITADTGNGLACLIMALFGAVFIWRSRNSLTTLLLGLGLINYGLASAIPQMSLSLLPLFTGVFIFNGLIFGSIAPIFYLFAILFYRDMIGPRRRWEYAVFLAYVAAQIVATAALTHYFLTLHKLPLLGSAFDVSTLCSYAGFLAAFIYMFVGWRRSRREAQQRYALMLVATSAIILAQSASATTYFLTILPQSWQLPLSIAGAVLSGLIAPPLFAYAILRHKVLDLGFAINRTLVYGVVSAVLLVMFGLAEWAFEHFLPFESHEASVLVDAGIALVVFLIFHRVRDFVEHHVEKLFFHAWHEKEQALRRFVREAGFILKRDPMIENYVAALRAFSDEADVALYLADEVGVYRRARGVLPALPDQLDADDPFMVTLRADRAPFEPRGKANIALVLPMIHRTEVIGVTLMGPKRNGFGYRPDEKEVLAWAAHQIGLDLHALEVERLQQVNASLSARYDLLDARYHELRSVNGLPVEPA